MFDWVVKHVELKQQSSATNCVGKTGNVDAPAPTAAAAFIALPKNGDEMPLHCYQVVDPKAKKSVLFGKWGAVQIPASES